MTWKPIDVAALYLGRREVIGPKSDPAILAMLKLDNQWPKDDATPWCSAFAAWCAYHAGFERSTSLRARSWLLQGRKVWTQGSFTNPEAMARTGDIMVFARGRGVQPGPEVIKAAGHVGFYTGEWAGNGPLLLGGNQGDKVSIKPYSARRLLGIRRLRRDATAGFQG